MDDLLRLTKWGLSFFATLTALQPSAVILKDVLGYSLEELSEILDASVPSVKGKLHRGRATLRQLAQSSAPTPVPPRGTEQARPARAVVALFDARDFDTLRAMLADDARLADLHLAVGVVDGALALFAQERPTEGPS